MLFPLFFRDLYIFLAGIVHFLLEWLFFFQFLRYHVFDLLFDEPRGNLDGVHPNNFFGDLFFGVPARIFACMFFQLPTNLLFHVA